MNRDENSISIINRNNGQVTGESTGALPIKFVGSLSWVKIFFAGFGVAILSLVIFVTTVKNQVVVVDVVGKSSDYQEYKLR